MRPVRTAALLAASATALFAGRMAFAETRIGADADASLGYSSSPFSGVGGTSSAGTGTVSLRPFIVSTNPNGQVRLGGEVSHTEYSRIYDGATNYSVNGAIGQQLSPRFNLQANAGYVNQVIDVTSPIGSPVQQPGSPNNPAQPVVLDPAAGLSLGQRQSGLNGGAVLTYQVGALDSVSVSGNAATRRFSQNTLQLRDYNYYGGGLTYERKLNASTSVGASVNAGRTDYTGTRIGDARQITPSAVVRTKLSPSISLNADAGVTFIDTTVAGGSATSTALSAHAGICREGVRSNLCFNAGRDVAPSAQIGVSKLLSFALAYDYKLSPRSSMSLTAGYSRASNIIAQAVNEYDYARAAATYSRVVTQRLSAVVSAGYSDSFSGGGANRSNFYGSVGLRYRFGDIR